MNTYPLIGASIFMYIVVFIAVMVIGGYLTYHVSPIKKQRREAKHSKRNT